MKINLAVDSLPVAAAIAGDGVQPYHRGIAEVNPTIAEMDAAQAEARAGRPAADPHIELCIPTVHDPSLAPEGKHVVTIDVNSQPYTLANGGDWGSIRDEVADRAIAKLGEYFPNLPGSILERQVLAPPDLERLLGIWGGHALRRHGLRPALQPAPRARLGRLPDARARPLPLRRRHPSGEASPAPTGAIALARCSATRGRRGRGCGGTAVSRWSRASGSRSKRR